VKTFERELIGSETFVECEGQHEAENFDFGVGEIQGHSRLLRSPLQFSNYGPRGSRWVKVSICF
jgi:hypothetical protein